MLVRGVVHDCDFRFSTVSRRERAEINSDPGHFFGACGGAKSRGIEFSTFSPRPKKGGEETENRI